jgi:hypothetical protein
VARQSETVISITGELAPYVPAALFLLEMRDAVAVFGKQLNSRTICGPLGPTIEMVHGVERVTMITRR